MIVRRLCLAHWRNISAWDSGFHPVTNLIYGDNAQGKTNLLESLVLLSCGKSFRCQKEQDLLQFGKDFATVYGEIFTGGREQNFQIDLSRHGKKKITKNQVPVKNNQELRLKTVLFCPEDLALVKSGARDRRDFLDRAICQLRPQYEKALMEYRKLLLHKGKILKNPQMYGEALRDFNLRLAQTGAMVIHYRAHFIRRLQEILPGLLLEFSGQKEDVSLQYDSLCPDPLAGEQAIFQAFLAKQERLFSAELSSGKILLGAQRDDLRFFLQGREVRDFGSQGQCRSLVICLKLAVREIFFQETGEYPVLLLDDVLSELDFSRQEYILNRIATGQTFLTCCHKEGFHGLKEGGLFGIAQGQEIV